MSVKTFKWLKLYNNFFADPKIRKLRKIPGGDTYTCIFLKMMLASINTDGVLEHEGIEPTLEAELALKLDEDEMSVKIVLGFLDSQNLAEIEKNMITFPTVPDLIGEETESAIRMRKMRQKNRQQSLLASQSDVTVTEQLPDSSQPVTTEKDIELELEKDIEPSLLLPPKNEIERVDFKTFKRELIKFCPDLEFKLKEQNQEKLLDSHLGFCLKNGYIYNLQTKNFLDSTESLAIWQYLYEKRIQVFEQAQIQNNQRAHHE